MEDPSKRWPLLPCDSHVLGRFSFLIPKNKFSHHVGCGKVWPNMANGTLTKISLDRWIPWLHDGCFLLQNWRRVFLEPGKLLSAESDSADAGGRSIRRLGARKGWWVARTPTWSSECFPHVCCIWSTVYVRDVSLGACCMPKLFLAMFSLVVRQACLQPSWLRGFRGLVQVMCSWSPHEILMLCLLGLLYSPSLICHVHPRAMRPAMSCSAS